MKFAPPPKVGQIFVRKSYRCAATRPVTWCFAASGPPITKVMKSMASGRNFAGNVRMKNETLFAGFSCAKLYAKASIRDGKKLIPPRNNPSRICVIVSK